MYATPARRSLRTSAGLPALDILAVRIAAVGAAAVAMGALFVHVFAAAPPPRYEMITVGAGDTLWSIAAAAAPDRDVRDEVGDIVSDNHLKSPGVHAGQQLRVRIPS